MLMQRAASPRAAKIGIKQLPQKGLTAAAGRVERWPECAASATCTSISRSLRPSSEAASAYVRCRLRISMKTDFVGSGSAAIAASSRANQLRSLARENAQLATPARYTSRQHPKKGGAAHAASPLMSASRKTAALLAALAARKIAFSSPRSTASQAPM